MDVAQLVKDGKAVLGIEFGSTRIKAVVIDENNNPIAMGSHEWENRLENDIWTYSEDDIIRGMQHCYSDMLDDVRNRYNVEVNSFAAIGFSAMMHGYIVLDKNGKMLVPFRTWRNTITGEASRQLTDAFDFHIPQRWSIAHLYQAMLNKENHIESIDYLTTLAGFIQYRLAGSRKMGVGEASGMFPIDINTIDYNDKMIDIFNKLASQQGYNIDIKKLLPSVVNAGENAGVLTLEGALLLDPSGKLQAGIPLCPPEGDAGTGMVATNAVRPGTGNVSAGTSVFAMVVLEKNLEMMHEELDMVTTPDGKNVAMVHCNNCTSDINAWVSLFKELLDTAGFKMDTGDLFSLLFNTALKGDADCGGLLSYNYFSGEHIVGFDEGRPLFVRRPDSSFTLANFMRTQLYSALGALKVGLDILLKEEKVQVESITGHGGLFKTPVVGQKILAGAINAPVTVLSTAGEGGAWGIAVLASYMINRNDEESLPDYLNRCVFSGETGSTINPDPEDVSGFEKFMDSYKKALLVEEAAISNFR